MNEAAPSERELDVLKVLWELGESKVRDIHSTQATDAVSEAWRRIAGLRGARVRLLISKELTSPLMFGWWRPVVIVPQSIANRGGLELDGCLAHEWSHLDRRDVDSDIASELLCSSSQGDLLFIDSDGTLLRKMDPGFASHMVRAWSPLGSTNGQLVILSAGTLRDPVPQGKEPQTKLVAIDIGGNQKWSVDLSGRVIDSAIATNRPWLSVALADGSMRVIDVSSGKDIARLESHTATTSARVAWLPIKDADPLLVVGIRFQTTAYRIGE